MNETTRRRFIGRADGANAISLNSPTALSLVEEEILHLKESDDKEGAQSILLASQDALRMFPQGIHQRFFWIACLPIRRASPASPGLTPQQGVSLWETINEGLAALANPVTSAFCKASGRPEQPLTSVVCSASRLHAETRAWIAFHCCLAPQHEQIAEYVSDCFQNPRQSRSLAIFVPIADPSMSLDKLHHSPTLPIGPSKLADEIEGLLRQQIAVWNRRNPAHLLEAMGPLQRISQMLPAVEELDLRASFLETLQVKAPLQDIAKISNKPLQPVVGSMRSATPHPGQMITTTLCDAETARCLTFGFGSLLAGTPLSLAKKVIEDILTESRIAFSPTIVLPAGPLCQTIVPGGENFRLPCMDGEYRPIQQTYYGKAGWQIKSFEWIEGWRWDINSFASREAVKEIGSLPHPIALSVAGAEAALRCHYDRDFLDRLREQMKIPGRSQTYAMAPIYNWLPDLADVEDQFEDAVEPRTGIYAAEHWRLAKGALFIVKNTLTMRLEETDFEDKFPAKYIHSPYPDAYFHFETPLAHDIDPVTQFLITGFYVSEESFSSIGIDESDEFERLLVMNMTYQYTGETVRFGSIPVTFPIQKDDDRFIIKTYSEAMEKSLQANPIPQEALGEMKFCVVALSMAVKVLIYSNLKNARMENHQQKTKAIEASKNLSGAKKQREAEKIRRIFDYINLGPEETHEDRLAVDLKARKMKVHWRKGFIRNQRYGTGLSETRQRWIAPVLVNAGDLKSGQDAPDIPRYIVE